MKPKKDIADTTAGLVTSPERSLHRMVRHSGEVKLVRDIVFECRAGKLRLLVDVDAVLCLEITSGKLKALSDFLKSVAKGKDGQLKL